MSKLVAIFYTVLILFQSLNISFEDVSKFSALMEHASYHQETYGDSFFDFLSEHYGEASVAHENEHSEHENLPFKHNDQNCCHINTSFTLQNTEFIDSYEAFIEIPLNFHYKESFSLFEKPSVFQPPKFA
ncbi:hypothetical protein [Gelidibacter maritimus]|uniref:Uncharacterized protein n=1 Tax=Gelidibacter maritimus TaxID=2761487 RepID=A0A7W2M2S3_9FLAO|nr:hypothetical protein [Gelidibacter maritimus]MBA6151653.1 hypothetical protein [Gelidibacter maritimus]